MNLIICKLLNWKLENTTIRVHDGGKCSLRDNDRTRTATISLIRFRETCLVGQM